MLHQRAGGWLVLVRQSCHEQDVRGLLAKCLFPTTRVVLAPLAAITLTSGFADAQTCPRGQHCQAAPARPQAAAPVVRPQPQPQGGGTFRTQQMGAPAQQQVFRPHAAFGSGQATPQFGSQPGGSQTHGQEFGVGQTNNSRPVFGASQTAPHFGSGIAATPLTASGATSRSSSAGGSGPVFGPHGGSTHQSGKLAQESGASAGATSPPRFGGSQATLPPSFGLRHGTTAPPTLSSQTRQSASTAFAGSSNSGHLASSASSSGGGIYGGSRFAPAAGDGHRGGFEFADRSATWNGRGGWGASRFYGGYHGGGFGGAGAFAAGVAVGAGGVLVGEALLAPPGPPLILAEPGPPIVLQQSLVVENYSAYSLAPPPPGDRWIHYGRDLVLVRLSDRRIIRIQRGLWRPPAQSAGSGVGAPPGGGILLTVADPEELPGDPAPPGVLQ